MYKYCLPLILIVSLASCSIIAKAHEDLSTKIYVVTTIATNQILINDPAKAEDLRKLIIRVDSIINMKTITAEALPILKTAFPKYAVFFVIFDRYYDVRIDPTIFDKTLWSAFKAGLVDGLESLPVND